MVLKFYGKAQFSHNLGRIAQSYAEIVPSTKCPHQGIRWNYFMLRNGALPWNGSWRNYINECKTFLYRNVLRTWLKVGNCFHKILHRRSWLGSEYTSAVFKADFDYFHFSKLVNFSHVFWRTQNDDANTISNRFFSVRRFLMRKWEESQRHNFL